MLTTIKWLAVALSSAASLILAVLLVLFARGTMQVGEVPEITVQPPVIPSDAASVARGRHIAEAVALCVDCHQNGLRGAAVGLPALVGKVAASNLTAGKGGVGGEYTAADWDRAIRHGIARDGRKLVIMPSEFYAQMTDSDFAALVSFLRTLTPVDNELPDRTIGVLGGALLGTGRFPPAADVVRHEEVGQHTITAGVSEDYGSYLVTLGTCRSCHGAELRGTGGGVGPPPGPSLVTSTRTWSAADFRRAIRQGRTPAGRTLDPKKMPWPRLANMTDDELDAVFAYVRSIPLMKGSY